MRIKGEAITQQWRDADISSDLQSKIDNKPTEDFELIEATPVVREAIRHGRSNADLENLAAMSGYRPMRSDAQVKVTAGLTDINELNRVLGSSDV
jgi:type II secretory ATPase GspE/PulE/Tfp pilus assembly ATPase PilB-like protein